MHETANEFTCYFAAYIRIDRGIRDQAFLVLCQGDIDEIDGSLFSAELGMDYFITDSPGLEIALSSFSPDVELTSLILNGALRWKQNSVQAYVINKD